MHIMAEEKTNEEHIPTKKKSKHVLIKFVPISNKMVVTLPSWVLTKITLFMSHSEALAKDVSWQSTIFPAVSNH